MLCPIKLTKQLIKFHSITPFHGGAIDFLANLLKEYSFDVKINSYGKEGYLATNLYATFGKGEPHICFLGHIDVVPPGEGWDTDPFNAHEKNGNIYGRGAVDMKSGVAAIIASCINYCYNTPIVKGKVSILITSDEEGIAEFGTKSVLKDLVSQGYKWDFCIVGEPTCKNIIGDTILIGRKGSMNCELTIHGKQGHVAYFDIANNPNTILIKILNELINTPIDKGSDLFSASSFQVTSIDTKNEITNVIPAKTIAKFNIRFNPIQEEETLLNFLNEKIKKYSDNFELNSRIDSQSYFSKNSPFIEMFATVIKQTLGVNPKLLTDNAASDARFIAEHCPVIEFGLKYEMAHQINEFVSIKDLQNIYTVYYNALCKLLN